MSRRETAVLLQDAADAIVFLREHIGTTTRDDFLKDELRRSAAERKLEILGEALSRLRRIDPVAFARIPDAARAIAMRNIISHGYDVVDPAVLWDTVQHDVPLMADAIEQLRSP